MQKFPYSYKACLQLPSQRFAEIVNAATAVDPELRPGEVERITYAEGSQFHIHVSAQSARSLRTAVTSFYDFVKVSLAALETFG